MGLASERIEELLGEIEQYRALMRLFLIRYAPQKGPANHLLLQNCQDALDGKWDEIGIPEQYTRRELPEFEDESEGGPGPGSDGAATAPCTEESNRSEPLARYSGTHEEESE